MARVVFVYCREVIMLRLNFTTLTLALIPVAIAINIAIGQEYSAELSVTFQFKARWYQACSKRPLCSSLKPANMACALSRVQPRPGRRKR